MAELDALVDIAESKEEFQYLFEKKYNIEFPNFYDYIYQNQNKMSNFDKNL